MPSLVTKKFRIQNAKKLLESISLEESVYYMFIGKASAFPDENNPPAIVNTIQSFEYDVYRDIIAMKRIQTADASLVIPRYNWTSGTIYKSYSDKDVTPYSETLTPSLSNVTYVYTDDNNVYRCIDNNRGAPSTVKPTGTSTSIITTSDGYRWKFLYKISTADALRFITTNYIPVKSLTENDGSTQWSVRQTTANGAIHHIAISSNGSNYLSISNTIASVTNSTVLSLTGNISTSDDIYKDSAIYISSGLGAGQLRRVTRYIGATKTITVNGAFTTTPNTSSRYVISPLVLIQGDSGSTPATKATAYVSNCSGGQVRKITMVSNGLNYSTANVLIIQSQGSGAAATPIISPPGGHGYDAADELGASNLMLNIRIIGNEANSFPANNNFRMIGVMRDPLLRSGNPATSLTLDQCTRIGVAGATGDFSADEFIVGASSGTRAQFIRFDPDSSSRVGVVRVNRVTTGGTGLTFSVGETITGQTSGKTAIVTSVDKPAVREYTGDILYVENRKAINRAADQIEDIKVVIRF